MASEANEANALALISFEEVKKHSYSGDCWVIVNGQVYDLSAFDHPGGSESKYGGFHTLVCLRIARLL